MLDSTIIDRTLGRLPTLRLGVLGDLFLDRYLDIDAALTEPSIETGLDAYQVVRVRSYPGAAGTVINNLVALGVGHITPIAVLGDDGEGFELQQALAAYPAVSRDHLMSWPGRRTPTYTKPMLCEPGKTPRELNRLDIKNRTMLPPEAERFVLDSLERLWPKVDAWLILDQVSEENCGVVTSGVRRRLAELAATDADKIVLADSRERIGMFRNVALKPNVGECQIALGQAGQANLGLAEGVAYLAEKTGRPVFCTRGAAGMLAVDPRAKEMVIVDAYPVPGPVDTVGAGDSTNAALACALACGASLPQAAAFGNLVASITVQQLGTTGTATPAQVLARWQEISG